MSVEYSGVQALSNSALSALNDHPAEFVAKFIRGDWKEEVDAFRMGLAVHTLALEPEKFDERFEVISGPINPKTGRPYGRDTLAYEAWLKDFSPTKGKQILSKDEYESAVAMVRSLRAHPAIGVLLDHPDRSVEEPLFGSLTFENGALDFKGRPDLVIVSEGIVLDIKTCERANPSSFKESLYRYGYERQAWLYCRLLSQKYGKEFTFYFGAVQKKPDRAQDDVATMDKVHPTGFYSLGDRRLERAERDVIRLCELYWKYSHDGWPGDWRREACLLD